MRCPQGVLKTCLAVLLAGGLVGLASCNKLRARDLINKGVQAYKSAQFDKAEENFKKAAELDPKLMMARVYLATCYASQFVPGSPSPGNMEKGKEAIAQFKKVLEQDPKNVSAIDGIGSMLFRMGKEPYNAKLLKESKKWNEKHIQLKPNDAQPYYWIGVIDWSLTYRANQDMRKNYNQGLPKRKKLKGDAPLPKKLREQFSSNYEQTVDEGMKNLRKAMELRSNYTDAMAYLNLLYRQKADMVATPEERKALLKKANDLVQKVNQIKQEEQSSSKSSG